MLWAAAGRAEAGVTMWSVRAVVESVVEHGRRALHHQLRRRHPQHQQPQHQPPPQHHLQGRHRLSGHKLSKSVREGAAEAAGEGCGGTSRAGLVASRLRPLTTQLVQNICRRVPAPLWTEARRRTTQRLVFGASAPYFALVGVSLVGGSHGLVTRDDELEALCGTVREAISRSGWLHNPEFWQSQPERTDQQKQQSEESQEGEDGRSEGEHVYSLADFTLGPVIDKGCNAVVYAARWKTDESNNHRNTHEEEEGEESCPYSSTIREVVEGLPYPQEPVNGVSTSSLGASFLHSQGQVENGEVELVAEEQEEADISPRESRSQGAVARTPATPPSPREGHHEEDVKTKEEEAAAGVEQEEFPLAIKMMFNYEAESNAPAILRAMCKEIVPARCVQFDEDQKQWQERLCGPRVCLSPHSNIVDMPCVFVDRVPLLEGCHDLYPQALPARLNPQGYGRNMSLFCVMKRYDTSLREYLSRYRPSQRTCLLLVTQLLEAMLHLRNNNIAHRDLKSDNILLSLAEGWQYPLLVVSDFGCSLAGESSNLSVPFPSREGDPRQGNPALMAPEVKTATPGLLSSVSFGQSDLWAAGTLIYEIYGLDNPFCPSPAAASASPRRPKQLDSATYKESQLPRLPRSAPPWVRHLVSDILRRNPRARPTINVAATLCQLMMWAPSKWLNRHSLTLPTHTEVTQWLLCLATKVLCEARLPSAQAPHKPGKKRAPGFEGNADHQGSQLEYQMVSTFLGRVQYVDIIQAIKWNRAF